MADKPGNVKPVLPGVQPPASFSANDERRRIKNVAPEEMWKRVAQCELPTYPPLAFLSEVTGTVDIELHISPKAEVVNSRPLYGHPSSTAPSIEALRHWKFQPKEAEGAATLTRVRALTRFNTDGTTAVDLARALKADDFGDPGTPSVQSADTVASTQMAVPRPPTAPPCKSAQPSPAALAKDIEGSEVSPGVYKNNYFGLTFRFPPHWQIADRAALDSIDRNLRKVSQGEQGALSPKIYIFALPYYTLFSARTDGPIGSPRNFIRIGAEEEIFIRDASQYFSRTRFLNDKTADGTRGPEELEIGGTRYYRGDRWRKVGDRNTYEVRLVTYVRDTILSVDIEADAAATAENLVKSLDGMQIIPPR